MLGKLNIDLTKMCGSFSGNSLPLFITFILIHVLKVVGIDYIINIYAAEVKFTWVLPVSTDSLTGI